MVAVTSRLAKQRDLVWNNQVNPYREKSGKSCCNPTAERKGKMLSARDVPWLTNTKEGRTSKKTKPAQTWNRYWLSLSSYRFAIRACEQQTRGVQLSLISPRTKIMFSVSRRQPVLWLFCAGQPTVLCQTCLAGKFSLFFPQQGHHSWVFLLPLDTHSVENKSSFQFFPTQLNGISTLNSYVWVWRTGTGTGSPTNSDEVMWQPLLQRFLKCESGSKLLS